MEEPTELDRLLSELGQAESSGKFTIAADKALDKLARFQLPAPQAWLAKLFQAAHQAKLPVFEVEGSASGVLVKLDCPRDWTAAAIEEVLLSPHPPEQNALADLVIGLRSAVMSQGMTLKLSSRPAPGPAEGFIFRASKFERVEEPARVGVGTMQILLQRSRDWSQWQAEKMFLTRRCASAVTRLLVNGDDVEQWPSPEQEDDLQLFAFSKAHFPRRGGELCAQRGVSYRFWDLSDCRPFNPDSMVAWVRHGVIVESLLEVSHPEFCLQYLIKADHLTTDLTGWQLRHDPEEDQQIAWVLEQAKLFLDELKMETNQRLVYPRKLMKARRRGAYQGAALLAVGGALLWSALPSWLPLTLTPEYYLWFAGHTASLLAPWAAGGLGVRWLGLRRQEHKLLSERRQSLAQYAEGLLRRLRREARDRGVKLEG